MIAPLVFLVVGGTFVFSLLSALLQLLGGRNSKDGLTGARLFSIFKLPLICFVVITLFILFGIPYLEANGLK